MGEGRAAWIRAGGVLFEHADATGGVELVALWISCRCTVNSFSQFSMIPKGYEIR